MYVHAYICVRMYSTCMYVHTYIVTFADTYMSGYCLLLPLSTTKLNLKLLNKIQPSEQPENKYQHWMAQLSTQKHHLGESVCTGAGLRAVNVDRVLNRMETEVCLCLFCFCLCVCVCLFCFCLFVCVCVCVCGRVCTFTHLCVMVSLYTYLEECRCMCTCMCLDEYTNISTYVRTCGCKCVTFNK